MTSTAGEPEAVVAVDDGALALTVSTSAATASARLTRFGPPGSASSTRPGSTLPLVDVVTPGTGRTWSGTRHAESAAGQPAALPRARGPGRTGRGSGSCIDLADPVTGLQAEVFYRILAGHGVLRSWITLTNAGDGPLTIESVTSFLCGRLDGGHWRSTSLMFSGRRATGWPRGAGSAGPCATRCPT